MSALFRPGTPLRSLRQRLEPGRLYGLTLADDWVTVIRRPDALHWRSMGTGDLGSGTRGDLEAYLRGRKVRAA